MLGNSKKLKKTQKIEENSKKCLEIQKIYRNSKKLRKFKKIELNLDEFNRISDDMATRKTQLSATIIDHFITNLLDRRYKLSLIESSIPIRSQHRCARLQVKSKYITSKANQ